MKYHYFDEDTDGMPIITLEVMPDSIAENVPYDSFYHDAQQNSTLDQDMKDDAIAYQIDKDESAGMHFLVDKTEPEETNESVEEATSNFNVRADLLEYITRSDGSVSCKMCGKVLASRTHWYRHKYRAHNMLPVNPAPLFQCEQCLVYFKSRKGYIGHIASKHSETLQDVSPVLTNAQAEALAKEQSKIENRQIKSETDKPEPLELQPEIIEAEIKKEPDPEMIIPKTVVPNFQNVTIKQTTTRSIETPRKSAKSSRQNVPRSMESQENANVENEKQWYERRSREEKLVADIIARVRRECEAQGTGGPARRGYSRKSGLHT